LAYELLFRVPERRKSMKTKTNVKAGIIVVCRF
jgi:hypothetical protein